jgi:predicted DsbA family dithiol-disulfide isomerase
VKPEAKPLVIEIASDVICPWCYIGKRRLEKALALLGGEVQPEIRWLPFQLNPEMPKEGIPRAEYRKAKFGSIERSRGLDARVAAEGEGEGISFAFERMQRTPNTVAAHQLIDLAQKQGRGTAVVDALFRAYFEEARDIGDAAVLAEIAASAGVSGWPQQSDGAQVAALEEDVRSLGISAVPTFILDRKLGVSGAQPPEALAQAMRQAAATPAA